jgi:hypothetical protein
MTAETGHPAVALYIVNALPHRNCADKPSWPSYAARSIPEWRPPCPTGRAALHRNTQHDDDVVPAITQRWGHALRGAAPRRNRGSAVRYPILAASAAV